MLIRSIAAATLLGWPLVVLGGPLTLEVNAGKHDRAAGTPLACDLPVGLKEAGTARLLVAGKEGGDPEPFSAQVIPGRRTQVVWILQAPLKAGESRRYELDLRTPPEPDEEKETPTSLMNCLEFGSHIEILDGSDSILQYNKEPTPAAAEHESFYSRTGYIHPLRSPSGKEITGDYAADHPHQHGIFFAWTNTTFEGRDINFWDQKAEKARISYRTTIKTQGGPVFAQFAVTHLHEDLTAPGGSKPVLNERWQVRAYRTGRGYWLIDLHSTQNCASESPLTINQYHYGGMAIRGADEWFVNEKNAEQPSGFLTSEGKNRANGNHSRPNWVDHHGTFANGSKAGVAIFSHPENFRTPQPVRLHPSKPYFVFTPQVDSGFAIEPGSPYISQYRYLVHDGAPDPELLDRVWRDYAEPAEVSIIKEP